MIGKTLQQIIDDLNDFLGEIYDPTTPPYKDRYAEIRNVAKLGASPSPAEKKISVMLVNVEEDVIYKNHINPVTGSSGSPLPPLGGDTAMRVNLYVLFAFNPGNTSLEYSDSLALLTHVLSFFHQRKHYDISIPMTGGGSKEFDIRIDYHNINLEDSNNLWSNLGGEQKPFSIYRIQLMEIDPEALSLDPVIITVPNVTTSGM